MPNLDWAAFESLDGSKSQNFENLCRGLVRLHYGQYGIFKALSNQPGVEFHLELKNPCPLGNSPRWFGWQCKFHKRTQAENLKASSKRDIEESLKITRRVLPHITDWVLWTPYTLSKSDQTWFYSLSKSITLALWSEDDLDSHLCGNGLIFRETYFDELILSYSELSQRHSESIQSIKERWMPDIHQKVEAERNIRRMLGEPGSWVKLKKVGNNLIDTAQIISQNDKIIPKHLKETANYFKIACDSFAETLLGMHKMLSDGDLEIIQQKLIERKSLINSDVIKAPREFRKFNLSIALDITNALDDMHIAQVLLDEVEDFISVGLVVVLSDSGNGKTQLAAQLTAPQKERPAGILLHGRDLHKGHNLDNLANNFHINGLPLSSFERLLASLDAVGKRTGSRLPIVIDGLNEAENPKDWKSSLSILTEVLKRFPNVLVICTLRTGEHKRLNKFGKPEIRTNVRESFAIMAIPKGTRTLESEGFGGDVDNAVIKYFQYYKIEPGDAEIPKELFQHPLTLRIFCEVTNPKRINHVNVDYFPASLFTLFEKYITNACERIVEMTNISHSYTLEEVELGIYCLGLEIWKSKKREISENNYKIALSGSSIPWDNWDSNIVNLFAQEGIIFRNPGTTPDDFYISPVFDALGGYLAANSILIKQKRNLYKWICSKDVIETFSGDNSHALAYNIFISIVSLCPHRLNGELLWNNIDVPFKNTALRLSSEIDAQFIDADTVNALINLLKEKPNELVKLYSRLHATRSATNHALNSKFLDTVLKGMSVSNRDLSWTEWIRSTRSERLNDIIAIERRWKNDIVVRTQSDYLRAIWLMWLLTSSIRELRDIATRALYWYGRGNPELLFELSIESLNCNDPYVPERMVAASYGVAMACHTDTDNNVFVNKTLPNYAKSIFKLIFSDKASYNTTHILLRDFASKTIQLALLYNPKLLSKKEANNSKYPFKKGHGFNWKESKNSQQEIYGVESPFRMDFENYTIGHLVPVRNNYDFKNKDYQKIRSQILWRIEQLGWTKEKYSSIDQIISTSQNLPRSGSDANKIDRYGKKYSWIAYFEMMGYLQDTGALKNWDERTSSVEIDPSFPEPVNNVNLIDFDILGDEIDNTKEWIINGSIPEIETFFKIDTIQQDRGPWIALDGYLSQEDIVRDRKLFCFTRSFLIRNKDKESLFGNLEKQNLGNRWLPEKPEDHYVFGGEFPWCDIYPKNGLTELSFVTNKVPIKVKQSQYEYFLDGKSLGKSTHDFGIHYLTMINRFGEIDESYTEEELKRIKTKESFIEVDDWRYEHQKYNIIIPVRDFSWEDYHTTASVPGHAINLAKEIATNIGLICHPQTFDYFTKNGNKAAINISNQHKELKNRESWFFIKEDLLINYLKKHDLTFIWVVWGERNYSYKHFDKHYDPSHKIDTSYKKFSFVKELE